MAQYTATLADSKKQLQSALRLIDFLPVNVAVFYCISKWSSLVELMLDNSSQFVQRRLQFLLVLD
jgi:hypothetical protein